MVKSTFKCILYATAFFMFGEIQAQTSSDTILSLSLEQAIDYAKSNSATLKNKQLDITNAAEQVKQVKAMGLPQVNASIAYNQFLQVPGNWIENFIKAPGSPEYIFLQFQQPINMSATFQASQLIFDGTYFLGLKAAKEYTNVSKLLKAQNEQELEYNIAEAYIQTVGMKANLVVLESNIKTIDSNLRVLIAMHAEGFIEKLDIDKLNLTRANIVAQKEKLEGGINILNNVLKIQLGSPYNANLILTDDMNALNSKIRVPDLNSDATTEKFEVKLMEQQLTLSQLNEKRYKVSKYPRVIAIAQHQQSTQRPEFNFFNSNLTPNNNWVPSTLVGLNVSIPIFDGFQNKSKIVELVNNRTKMQNDLENFKRFNSIVFLNSKIQYLNNIKMLELQKENILLSKQVYEKSRIKYSEGVGSSIEITQAQNDMVAANTQYQTALNDVVSAKIAMIKTLGQKIFQ